MAKHQYIPGPSMLVCPVTADNLSLHRAGRLLLCVPHIAFGMNASQGSCTMIVGPNGAGKSLLVRSLCGLSAPDAGNILWAGLAPDAARRHQVGLMLQKPVLLRRSALANLVYALRHMGVERSLCHEKSLAALQQAGLAGIGQVPAYRLSGGEQQRLALARALLQMPDILFLDEATANVDPASTLVIEQQLREAISHGLTVVMVSHDPGQVRRLGDHIVLMHKGRVIEQADHQLFFEQPCHPLTKRWIAGELLV